MTRPAPDTTHVDDLAAPYALGALNAAERARVESHLPGCAACAVAVDDARRTVTLLPFLARPTAPRPDVKAALFARIAQADQTAAAARRPVTAATLSSTITIPASRPAPASRPGPPAAGAKAGRQRRMPGWPHLHRHPAAPQAHNWPVMAPLAAVPLVLVLALGGWAVSLRGKLHDTTTRVNTLSAQLTAMHALVADQNGNVYTYDLTGGPAAPQAVGKIYADPIKSQATLMVWNLRQPATNAPYTVWMEKNNQMVRVAELPVDRNGNGAVTLNVDGSLAQYRSVHVAAVPVTTGATRLATSLTDDDALSTVIEPRVGMPLDMTGP